MGRLVRFLVFAAVLWSGYWFAAGYGLRSSITGWFRNQSEQGWQADFADISTSGYPLEHVTLLISPALADPVTGAAWRSDSLIFVSPAFWPGRQSVRFADTPQLLSYFDQTAIIEAEAMQADLVLKPGIALELERMALTSGPWSVLGSDADVAAAQDLTVSMTQQIEPEIYAFSVKASAFAPGETLRAVMGSAPSLPPEFEALELDVTVHFDRPWDRNALEERRPQPRVIDLSSAQVTWGALHLLAAGKLSLDPDGIPNGKIAIKAENWREMLAMAQAAGAVPQQAIDPAERVLGLLAGLGGNPNSLDVQLNFRDGLIALGPLPLGPAPRIFLR